MQYAVQNVREMMFEGCSFGFGWLGECLKYFIFYVFFAARFSLEGCLLCFLACLDLFSLGDEN